MKLAVSLFSILFTYCLPVTCFADAEISEIGDRHVAVQPGDDILLIGDSHAGGLRHELKMTAKSLGYKFSSITEEGSLTCQFLPKLRRELRERSHDLVIVALGTNDTIANDSWIERNKGCYSLLVKMVRDKGSEIVWVGVPKYQIKRLRNVDTVSRLIAESGADVFNSADIDIVMSNDKIHATIDGYSRWADAIWDWMAEEHHVFSRKD
jgi:lysophospholipase L1-like esterase